MFVFDTKGLLGVLRSLCSNCKSTVINSVVLAFALCRCGHRGARSSYCTINKRIKKMVD